MNLQIVLFLLGSSKGVHFYEFWAFPLTQFRYTLCIKMLKKFWKSEILLLITISAKSSKLFFVTDLSLIIAKCSLVHLQHLSSLSFIIHMWPKWWLYECINKAISIENGKWRDPNCLKGSVANNNVLLCVIFGKRHRQARIYSLCCQHTLPLLRQ